MKIVTIGELMLRLSTPGHDRFTQATSFDISFGGSEANVAVSLAQYGHGATFVSRLPDHAIGQAAVNDLRRHGVRTEYVVRGGERIGAYFLEQGASQRPSQVVYDRAHSAFSQMRPEDVDWAALMEGAQWLHWSGITPALGANVQACLEHACRAARNAGATISCDLNFRAKLWSEQEAQRVMRPLMAHVDVCIANEEDAQRSLGFAVAKTNVEQAELNEAAYSTLARELKAEFDFRAVAITLRESFSASHNAWSAILHDEADCRAPYRSSRYEIQIVDRVGAGDSFAGGLIHGLLTRNSSQEALEFAVAASCLKHTLRGDYNLITESEVQKLMGGRGSGRVER